MSRAGDRSLLALSSLVGLTGADPESRTTWIHVAPFGEWKGHSEGSFALTSEHFDSVRAVLANKSTPVSLDYEHASIRPKGGPTPAAGYANCVEVRPDGLWARVEFTQRAAELIRAGEYRFCSGVFDFASVDPETGEPLLCVLDTIALTNRPFIDGQQPIALSRPVALTSGVSMEIDLKALAKLLDAIPGANTADKIKKALDLMSAGDDAAKPADAPPADAAKADASKPTTGKVALTDAAPAVALADKPAESAPCADPAPMPMADAPPVADASPDADADAAADDVDAKLMAATGLDIDGLAQAILANFDAVVALLMGAGPADNAALARGTDLIIKGKDAQIVTLTKELNALRVEKREREAKAIEVEVDALIRRAPALASERASFVTLARTAPAEFRRVATAIAPVAPDLTRPHAVALSQVAPPVDAAVAAVDDNHPQLVATRASLSRVFSGEALEKAIAKAKAKIAAG